MNRRPVLLVSILAIGSIFFTSKSVTASEGTAFLTGSQTTAECFAASVLTAPAEYRILITCRNLTTPPQAETLFYSAWARKAGREIDEKNSLPQFNRGVYVFLGDISSGKLLSRSKEAFDQIFITAQKENSPSTPDLDNQVLIGEVQPIEFAGAETKLNSAPTVPVSHITLSPTRAADQSPSAGRSVVSTAFRVFLSVMAFIVIAAVIISILQRRSASK